MAASPQQSSPKKATNKKKTTAKDKAKQGYLPDMEPPSIPELDDLATRYTDVRDERMQLTEEEAELNAKLVELLDKHQLPEYVTPYGEKVFLSETKRKAKVRKVKDAESEDQD